MTISLLSDHIRPEGTHAARPAATAVGVGTLYKCSDHSVLYRSNGTTWDVYSYVLPAGSTDGHVATWDTGTAKWGPEAASGGGGGGIGSIKTAYKTAAESLASSTTLQNDDHLVVAIGASEFWVVECVLYVVAVSNTPDIQAGFTVPAGATLRRQGILGLTTGTTTNDTARQYSNSSGSLGVGATNNSEYPLRMVASVENGATAGNIQLQWAQSTSSADSVTVAAGSSMIATRVA